MTLVPGFTVGGVNFNARTRNGGDHLGGDSCLPTTSQVVPY